MGWTRKTRVTPMLFALPLCYFHVCVTRNGGTPREQSRVLTNVGVQSLLKEGRGGLEEVEEEKERKRKKTRTGFKERKGKTDARTNTKSEAPTLSRGAISEQVEKASPNWRNLWQCVGPSQAPKACLTFLAAGHNGFSNRLLER